VEPRTIEEFGEQWSRFEDVGGGDFFGSAAVLQDLCGPLLSLSEIAGRRVVEIGSGNGRIVNMLLDAGAAHVIAVEPSSGIEVLRRNTRDRAERVTCLQTRGESLCEVEADLALSIGVLHHLQDPGPTVRRVYEILPPGGRFLVWVYGREGNGAYIALAETLRVLTRRLPDAALAGLAHPLNAGLGLYVVLCRYLPLPLGTYMREVMARFDRRKRFFLIFDQLNVGYARYYTGREARELLAEAGFRNVEAHHRHGMSWTVIGEKPREVERQAC
jgi:SAM-dependent methyltransferase